MLDIIEFPGNYTDNSAHEDFQNCGKLHYHVFVWAELIEL